MPDSKPEPGDFGEGVAGLHRALAAHGIEVSADEQQRAFFGPSTRAALVDFQQRKGLDTAKGADSATLTALQSAAMPASAGADISPTPPLPKSEIPISDISISGIPISNLPVHEPSPAAGGSSGSPAGSPTISGTVVLDYGVPSNALPIRVYSTGFGGTRSMLGETRTGADGSFSLAAMPASETAIQIYAVDANGTEVPLSGAVADRAELGAGALVAPGHLQPPASEYRRMIGDVEPHLNGGKLSDAVEQGDRSDFTVLAEASGWDVGALAMGAAALDGATSTGVPAEAFYALSRAGLPANPDRLARTHPDSVQRILKLAADSGVIDADVVSDGLAAFKKFAADRRLNTAPDGTVSSRKSFIDIAAIPDADKSAFSNVLVDPVGADIWTRAGAAGVTDDSIAKLRLQGKLAYLTFNSAPLVQELQSTVSDADQIADQLIAAGYHDMTRWSTVLDQLSGGDETKLAGLVPAAFSGTTTAARRDAYCTEMARRVRQMDPHRVTIERVANGEVSGVDAGAVGPLLRDAQAKGFRLGATPVSHFFATDGAALAAEPEAIKQVKKLAAIYAVSPSDEAMDALARAGMTSATQIAKYSLPAFVDRVLPFITPHYPVHWRRVIETIYWKAHQHATTLFNVFDGLKRLDSIRPPFAATPADVQLHAAALDEARTKVKALFPTWETLFGSVDYCECNYCRSVLSPSAYLVDILHFLDPEDEEWATEKANFQQRVGTAYPSQQKPFNLLDVRRPDLKRIALTCENTNVELPYIDVVNEILEQLVLSVSAATVEIEPYDVGTATSADLIAEPQHLQWDAYVGSNGNKGLVDLVFPLALPFDLPLEMARAFIHRLGIELWQLRERVNRPQTLEATGAGRADGWRDVWYERLGLGPADVRALSSDTEWFALFGYADEAAAVAALPTAKTLARRLDLTYSDLVEMVVRTRFVNDGASLVLHAPSAGCDFSEVTLQLAAGPPGASSEVAIALRKLNAFARLHRHLGWNIHELDRVLMGLTGGGALSSDSFVATMQTILVNLAHLVDVSERFAGELEREEIVLLWSDIPTVGVDCLYDRLFLQTGPTGHDVAFDRVNGVALGDSSVLIADHLPALQQAFLLSHDDLAAIIEHYGLQAGALTLANVSSLQRPALLARGLALSVADTIILLELSSAAALSAIEPGSGSDLAHDAVWSGTIAFLDQVRLLADAGIDVETLAALCNGTGPEMPDPPSDPAVLAVLAVPPEPARQPDSELASMTDADRAAAESAIAAKVAQREAMLVRTLAAQFGVAPKLMERLVGTVLKGGTPGEALLKSGFTDFDAVVASVTRIRRALIPIAALGVTDKELDHLLGISGALDLEALSHGIVPSKDVARGVFTSLQPWLELAALRKELGRSERALAVLDAAVQSVDASNTGDVRRQQFVDAVAALTGFKAAKLETVLDALQATKTSATQVESPMFATPGGLRHARETLRCFTKLRVEPKQVVGLAGETIGKDAATLLRSSLKASSSRSGWRALVKPIFDTLRARQRDALVAHLTTLIDGAGMPRFGATSEQLFEYLLLDPGMEPVVLGSRIQMAIASVQSFVQRCFMNLEQGVDSRIIDAARWSWMRRYRVWEANRKIFLWPENWLDPEFRDDRTHLFRELEGTLLQGDVSDDLVRTAMYTYLQGLEQIARVHLLAMYFEPIGADSSVVHVIGRTQSIPYKYFSRSMSHGMWTPWVPIDIGIEGDHLVLTSWRGRLYLFWLTFFDEAQQPAAAQGKTFSATTGIDTSTLKPESKIKLKINWSEQVQGAWTAGRSSPDFVETSFTGVGAKSPEERALFFVRAVVVAKGEGVADDDLEIRVTNATAQAGSGHVFTFYSKLAPPLSRGAGSSPPAPPYDGVSPVLTKWFASAGPLTPRFTSAVRFGQARGADQSIKPLLGQTSGFSLMFPSNESMPVPETLAPAARPSARLSGYVFGDEDANHVAYRSSDGEVHDLFHTDGGWFYQSPSQDAAEASIATIEPAEHDPHGYAIDEQGAACIVYCGATKVHELVWRQLDAAMSDSVDMDTGWSADECYHSETDPAVGRPAGGIFAPDRGAVALTAAKRIIAVRRDANGAWTTTELVPAGGVASEPTAVVVTSTAGGVATVATRHVFYVGSDSNVHELRSDGPATTWTGTSVTQDAAAPTMPATGSQISAYVSYIAGSVYVVYRGADGFVHELACPFGGSWSHSPIGAGFTGAKGDPCGYARDIASERHVVYRGANDEVVELWHSNVWRENTLSTSVANTPLADGDVTGYSFDRHGTQHVVYVAPHGEPRELLWAPYGWTPGDYRLTNPFQDTDGTLAAPFFFEAAPGSDTFFVEPTIVETTVHTWDSWIVTTDEYVVPTISDHVFTAIHPNAVAVATTPTSLARLRPDLVKSKLLADDVTVRTRWGTILPRVERADATALSAVVHQDARAIVNLDAGISGGLVGSSAVRTLQAGLVR